MDKYDRLMQEIVAYLQGTWLAKAPDGHLDWGPITGSSEAEIEEAEKQIGKKIPAALKAWYRVAGKIPPYINDYDANNSLRDFLRAQETAVALTAEQGAEWTLTDTMLPFSQRIGEQFVFVDTTLDDPDDPPVFHFMEGDDKSHQVSKAFSNNIREELLSWLDFPAWDKENRHEIGSWQSKGYESWLARKRIMDTLRGEAAGFRRQLIAKIHDEDLVRNEITGPRQFQERWLETFPRSEIWRKLQSEGLRMPFDWIDPPE
jgi:hypothetical protein